MTADDTRLHETHVCRDCGAEITMPYARRDPEPVVSADAAWEALRVETTGGAPEPTWSGNMLRKHRPVIEAAIRGTETGLDIRVLNTAIGIAFGAQDQDGFIRSRAALADIVKAEYARLADSEPS